MERGRKLKPCDPCLANSDSGSRQSTSMRTETDKLERTSFFIPEATFLKFLHGITSYLTLSDNEPILFFPFQQVQGNLLLNRKNGDVLLT